MKTDVNALIDDYYKWLKDKTAWKQLKEFVEITTPYLDRHNDYIKIYLKQNGRDYILTDDSYTIEDLEQSGCSLISEKRQKFLELTLNGFGVQRQMDEIIVKTNQENFALNKHNLIQSILAVNDMFYLAKSTILSLFFEDVQAWLEASDIRFLSKVPFNGKSGYIRNYDFVIPKSRKAPERMIQTVNNPDKNKAEELAFGWLDTKETRPQDAQAFVIVNDNEREIPDGFKDALRNYDIKLIPWNERDKYTSELAA